MEVVKYKHGTRFYLAPYGFCTVCCYSYGDGLYIAENEYSWRTFYVTEEQIAKGIEERKKRL